MHKTTEATAMPGEKKSASTGNRRTHKQSSEKGASQYRPLISDQKLRDLYRAMLGCRLLEERTIQKQSKRTVPLSSSLVIGQEAVIVGATFDLRDDDTITAPSGEVILRHNGQKPRHKKKSTQASPQDVIAFAGASGAQLTIGTGIALANKTQIADRIVVSFGDDDAQSVGSWHEALHLAGLHRLPIIFVLRPCGAGLSGVQQAALASISESASIAGVMTIPVDATDVVAMYRVSFESVARARNGTGPTLIVSTRYIVDASDQHSKSSKTEIDPVTRMEAYLSRKGLFSKKWKDSLIREFA